MRFDVPWATVREVQVLTAETFRGETSPWKLVTRRTGSSIGLAFVPRHPSSFGAQHPGLSAGPLHDRFPGMDGKFGTLLGVLSRRQQRAIEGALRHHAAGLYTGTVDLHTAVRRR